MENKYKNLIQNAADIIFETDVNGHFIFVNDFTIQHLGYSEEEILGKPFTSFVRDDYKERLLNFYREVASLEINFPTIEFPIIKKDTTCIWGSQKVTVQRNAEGKMVGYTGIIRNIAYPENFESKEKIRLEKIENYNKTINYLSSLQFNDFDAVLILILQNTAIATQTDLVSYINYQNIPHTTKTSYDLHLEKIEIKNLTNDELLNINLKILNEKNIIIIPDLQKERTDFFIGSACVDSAIIRCY